MSSNIGIYIIFRSRFDSHWYCSLVGVLSYLGNLPGDIKIERESTQINIPITWVLII
ncbi:MAG: DUF2905 family protein [Candidatus Dadabacteria bacterium]|nr:DUF2905 family protein [Candidatus Dadabacteria bacterium]